MCNCNSLRRYDIYPADMQAYLRNYDKNFSENACNYAVSMMRRKSPKTDELEPIQPYTLEKAEELLNRHNVRLERNQLYNFVYVLNREFADRWGSSIEDERHLALAVKDVIDDADASPADLFDGWVMKMENAGVPLFWKKLI